MADLIRIAENEMPPQPIAPGTLDFDEPGADLIRSSSHASVNVFQPGPANFLILDESLGGTLDPTLGASELNRSPPQGMLLTTESPLVAQLPSDRISSQGASRGRGRGKDFKTLISQSKCPHHFLNNSCFRASSDAAAACTSNVVRALHDRQQGQRDQEWHGRGKEHAHRLQTGG